MNNQKKKNNRIFRESSTGFTLIEMVMVLAIFGIITSVVVYNHSKFSSNLIVTNIAYEIALAVRQAQVYTLSVRGVDDNSSNLVFNVPYGVYLSGAQTDKFVLFADLDKQGDYDGNLDICTGECREIISLQGGHRLSDICLDTDGSDECIVESNAFDSLVITFKRPDPDARMKAFLDDTLKNWVVNKANICVVSSRGDKTGIVTVNKNGQISIGQNLSGDCTI